MALIHHRPQILQLEQGKRERMVYFPSDLMSQYNIIRYGKSGDLGDLGSRIILKITEDLNKNIKLFLQKSIQISKQM